MGVEAGFTVYVAVSKIACDRLKPTHGSLHWRQPRVVLRKVKESGKRWVIKRDIVDTSVVWKENGMYQEAERTHRKFLKFGRFLCEPKKKVCASERGRDF